MLFQSFLDGEQGLSKGDMLLFKLLAVSGEAAVTRLALAAPHTKHNPDGLRVASEIMKF